jgi:hypothetical protein
VGRNLKNSSSQEDMEPVMSIAAMITFFLLEERGFALISR